MLAAEPASSHSCRSQHRQAAASTEGSSVVVGVGYDGHIRDASSSGSAARRRSPPSRERLARQIHSRMIKASRRSVFRECRVQRRACAQQATLMISPPIPAMNASQHAAAVTSMLLIRKGPTPQQRGPEHAFCRKKSGDRNAAATRLPTLIGMGIGVHTHPREGLHYLDRRISC